jgi:hypothetical protein
VSTISMISTTPFPNTGISDSSVSSLPVGVGFSSRRDSVSLRTSSLGMDAIE